MFLLETRIINDHPNGLECQEAQDFQNWLL